MKKYAVAILKTINENMTSKYALGILREWEKEFGDIAAIIQKPKPILIFKTNRIQFYWK
uniref:Uncharacterized protein n=1 Tax=viral metagenome TaxID=1070528 RepID=A0A6M3LQ80_9ZZZZ